MTQDEILSVVAASSYGGAGACVWLWQILSSPDAPNYPTSGKVKRALMFWTGGLFLVVSVAITQMAWPDKGMPRYSTLQGAALGISLLALFGVFLIDHLRNWLPARTHARIRQLMALASCKPPHGVVEARDRADVTGDALPASVVGPALLDLAASGVRVIGPNEGPSSVTEIYR